MFWWRFALKILNKKGLIVENGELEPIFRKSKSVTAYWTILSGERVVAITVNDMIRIYLLSVVLLRLGTFVCKAQEIPEQETDSTQYFVSEHTFRHAPYNADVLALIHVRLIDGTGNPVRVNQTLLLEDGVITVVGNAGDVMIPEEAKVVDLSGKTVIPGIVGMHNHLHIPGYPLVGDDAAKLYLASGVTIIQTCGATFPGHELELAHNIDIGRKVGPDIIPSAPFITGAGGNPNMIIPADEQSLRDTLQYWMDRGIKWFKVYRNISMNDLMTTLEVVHKNGGKVRGHLCSVTFEQGAKMGIDAIEHGLNSASDFRTNKTQGVCDGNHDYLDYLEMDHSDVRQVQQTMIDHRVFLTSTLSIYEASIPNRAYADQRSLQMMSPALRQAYAERRDRLNQEINDSTRNHRFRRIMEFEYQYVKMGGLLCSGVDAGRHVLPGYGDQRNFILLREAGLSTEEAVSVMTGNGAKALGRADIGTVEKGKRADLVVLDGWLDKNPAVIEQVETVFKKGVAYDPILLLQGMEGTFGTE